MDLKHSVFEQKIRWQNMQLWQHEKYYLVKILKLIQTET